VNQVKEWCVDDAGDGGGGGCKVTPRN
jgi:hypothetical protein